MWHSERTTQPFDFPRKGDQLFRSDLEDYENNSFLRYGTTANDDNYAQGYRRAALQLARHVVSATEGRDTLVFPIVFLYRHHVELMLKKIVNSVPVVLNRALTDDEKRHIKDHKLDLLWMDTKQVIVKVAEDMRWNPSLGYIEAAEEYINQLSEIDPNSFGFRYATSKKGAQSLPDRLQLLNIRNFAEMMERLSNFLNGVDSTIAELGDYLDSIESDRRTEAESN